MDATLLFTEYIRWHYDDAIKQFWQIWRSFLKFGLDFFSIPLLARTLFAPIYRIRDAYNWKELQVEMILQSMAVNVVARVIGFLLRTVVIIVGLAFELILLVLAPILFLVWLVLPALAVGLFIVGIFLVI